MATKTKKPKADEVEEDLELEELDEDVEEEAPKRGKSKSKGDEVEFGVADLAKYLKKLTGKEYSTRDLRTLIRKMAREDKARVKREIVAGNRTRYNWPGGLENAEVKAIIKAVTGGEVEEGKKAALAALKERKAKEGAKRSKKAKKAKAPEPEEDDNVEEIDEEDDDE
jgi:hypothetical protein